MPSSNHRAISDCAIVDTGKHHFSVSTAGHYNYSPVVDTELVSPVRVVNVARMVRVIKNC